MEAAIPIIETKNPENNEEITKPKDIKLLKIKSDKGTEFEIQYFIYKENIFFEASSQKILPQKKYKKEYSFYDIQKNKFFAMCENLKEIYEEIQNLIEEKENEIKLIEKSKLIILNIPLNTKKIKECIFEIEEVIENVNDQITDIYSYINQLLKKINDLEEINKNLEAKNQMLEEKYQSLEKKLEEIYNYLPIFKKEKEKENNEKEKDLQIIKNWIAPGKEVKLDLIFKKSRDGDKAKDFHKFCDNKKKTLILIETKEGRKFGGFSYNEWNHSNGNWKNNKNDFVFSLDLNKKYKNVGDCSTLGERNNGPVFGWCMQSKDVDILIEKSLTKGFSGTSSSFNTNYELNAVNSRKGYESSLL